MRFTFLGIMAAALLLAGTAFALDLHEARNSGILGEKADGYVAVLQKSPEADALAAEVNAKRRAEYQRISAENGQPVNVVATLAAQQILKRLEPGDKYQDASGTWQTR